MSERYTNRNDIVDIRDVITRVEELEVEVPELEEDQTEDDTHAEEREELARLLDLLADCEGGGDEEWRGNWYYGTLIRDSHFEAYAQELAVDIGAIDSKAGWPNNCIDWETAARELQMNYSSIDYDGVTYWTQ